MMMSAHNNEFNVNSNGDEMNTQHISRATYMKKTHTHVRKKCVYAEHMHTLYKYRDETGYRRRCLDKREYTTFNTLSILYLFIEHTTQTERFRDTHIRTKAKEEATQYKRHTGSIYTGSSCLFISLVTH